MPKTRAEGHVNVKITKGLEEAIQEFLESDTAKKMGLDSKSDVVAEALRDLFKKYGMPAH